MKKHVRGVLKRFGTFLLSLVLALSSVPAFPIEALAATLDNDISGLTTGSRFPQHILTKQAVYLGRRPYSP